MMMGGSETLLLFNMFNKGTATPNPTGDVINPHSHLQGVVIIPPFGLKGYKRGATM